MAVDDKVLDKIKKLLQLAGENGLTNDNQNEADSAFKMAARLMEKHGLAIADINMETGEVSSIEKAVIRQGQSKYKVWAQSLIVTLTNCFDCKVVLIGSENQAIVGTPSDVEMVTWYYKFLKIRIARGASTKFHYVKDQKTYGLGCVESLRGRLYGMFLKAQEEVRTAETTALVVVKKEQVEQKFKEMFPKLRKSPQRKIKLGSMTAYNQGRKDGQTMGLNRPLPGGSTKAVNS